MCSSGGRDGGRGRGGRDGGRGGRAGGRYVHVVVRSLFVIMTVKV